MDNQLQTPGKFSISYGVILGVVMILISVILYVTGWALEGVQWPQYVYYLIFPTVIFIAINKFKHLQGHVLSLGQALKIGVLIGVISAIVYIVYSLIFNYVIDPDFMNQILDVARDKMLEENPDMTEEMLEQSSKFMEMFMNPWVGSAFWIAASAFFGLIYSLIGGLIMKNDK